MSFFRKLFPKYGDDLATDGARAHNEGRTTEAIEKLTRALEMQFRYHARDKILTILGNAYCEIEEYDRAIAAHEEAITVNPKSDLAWTNLGIVQRKRGRPVNAEECYRKAIELDPENPEVHASLGALYIFLAEGSKAVVILERARALDPSVAVTLGYQNATTIRERIAYLQALEGDAEEAYPPGTYHLVCASCGTKRIEELKGDTTGAAITCADCGSLMTRFSTS